MSARKLAIMAAILTGCLRPAIAQRADEPAPHTTQGRGVSRAELFIASFGPGDSHSLHTSELAMREQVRLAFYGIDSTRVQIERGQLTATEGELIIDGFEQTIRNYLHDHSNDALVVASAGQASDIPAVSRSLGALLSVGRQDALMGREELAQAAQDRMVQVLVTFSSQFAQICEQQSFPVEVVLSLERQNQMMGTGIDVSHCAKRRMEAKIEYKSVTYEWSNCSMDGGGRWRLAMSGFLRGEGGTRALRVVFEERAQGLWRGQTTVVGPTLRGRYDGEQDEWQGGFEIIVGARDPQPETVATIPDDAGPNARPNNWIKESVPDAPRRTPLRAGTLRMEAINVVGDGYISTMSWVEAPITLEQKPCRSENDPPDLAGGDG